MRYLKKFEMLSSIEEYKSELRSIFETGGEFEVISFVIGKFSNNEDDIEKVRLSISFSIRLDKIEIFKPMVSLFEERMSNCNIDSRNMAQQRQGILRLCIDYGRIEMIKYLLNVNDPYFPYRGFGNVAAIWINSARRLSQDQKTTIIKILGA